MSTQWEYAFLNTGITKVFLILSFNYPHSNQNSSIFLFKSQYHFLPNWHFGNISPYYENNFQISFCGILPYSRETDLCPALMANTKLIVVYRFQTLNLNPTKFLRFANCRRKANKKSMPWHRETWSDVD